MKRNRTGCVHVLLGVLLLASSGAHAGRGAGELSLDRAAVASLIDAGLPRSLSFSLQGLGDLTLELEPPRTVEFVDGGVEGRVGVTLRGLRYTTGVHVRFVPRTDARSGVVRLEPESAEPDLLPPIPLDLAPLLPAIPLPRGSELPLIGLGDGTVLVRLHVHRLVVEEERLILQFGLVTRQVP